MKSKMILLCLFASSFTGYVLSAPTTNSTQIHMMNDGHNHTATDGHVHHAATDGHNHTMVPLVAETGVMKAATNDGHSHGHHTSDDGHAHTAGEKVHKPEVHMKCHDKISPTMACEMTEVYFDMTTNTCKTRDAKQCGPADSKNKFDTMSACLELCQEEIATSAPASNSETTTMIAG